MRQVRCNGCYEWFDAKNHECPECGHVRPAYNKWLRTAQLNGQLNDQLRSADREVKVGRSLGLG